MLTRDAQRLLLAVVLTILLFYSVHVYIARDDAWQRWYGPKAEAKVEQPIQEHKDTSLNIPIPLPHPNAEAHDETNSHNIALKGAPLMKDGASTNNKVDTELENGAKAAFKDKQEA